MKQSETELNSLLRNVIKHLGKRDISSIPIKHTDCPKKYKKLGWLLVLGYGVNTMKLSARSDVTSFN